MHLRKTLLVLSLTGALAAPLSLPALAADFADLPEPHWAYDTMMEAVGLGLSPTGGIVTRQGGNVKVSSARGQGATFSLFLPRG